jgi:urease accessory protein
VTPAVAPAASLTRVGRDGLLRLRFERRGTATVVAGARSTVPLQILAPVQLADSAAIVSVLNPTGGLVGGDRLSIDVDVARGAHGCVTTPSATKVYRTTADAAEQLVRLRVGPDATLEWVPDHTIPFAGSALRQCIDVRVGEGARLILVDAFAAGRVARGETWQFARLESAITVRDERGFLLHDRFVLGGNRSWASLGLADHDSYFATVVVIGPAGFSALARAAAAHPVSRADVRVGVGMLTRGGGVVRVLAAQAPALLDALDHVWTLARRAVLGLSPLALRKM